MKNMRYYPINLNINKQNCLVVGGGSVGTRKVKTLVTCGAYVTVISTQFSETLIDYAEKKIITLIKKKYETNDIIGKFLIIGATNDNTINLKISKDAKKYKILCNIAALPEACSFILPSIIQKGDLIISISTSGKSPAFSKKLKKDIDNHLGDDYAVFLDLMGAIRKKLLSNKHAPDNHKPIFKSLIESDLLEMIKQKKYKDINLLLLNILDENYQFEDLMRKK